MELERISLADRLVEAGAPAFALCLSLALPVSARSETAQAPAKASLRLLSEVGFVPRAVPFEHSELEPGSHEVFVGARPDRS